MDIIGTIITSIARKYRCDDHSGFFLFDENPLGPNDNRCLANDGMSNHNLSHTRALLRNG